MLIEDVPKIKNIYHLSNQAGIKWKIMKELSLKNFNYYHDFFVYQKNGKKRRISAPSIELEICQAYIYNSILKKIKISGCSFGFVEGKSVVDNAKMHSQSTRFINIDLENFFGTINQARVYHVFRKICNYDKEISYLLTKICVYKNSLPQGAATSPMLSNIIAYKLDKRIEGFCKKNNLIYTRYADDITISGDESLVFGKVLRVVSAIIREEGFKINDKKTKKFKNFASVTGVTTGGNNVYISRKYKHSVHQELYFIEKNGLEAHAKHKDIEENLLKEILLGKIMWIRQVEYNRGNELLQKFNLLCL